MRKLKKVLSLLLSGIISMGALAFVGCDRDKTPVDDYDYSGNPKAEELVKLNSFEYGDVTLTNGLLKTVYDGTADYYLSMPVNDILYGMRQAFGFDTKDGKNIGLGYGGNVTGQWMQAHARYYNASKDPALLAKITDLTEGLMEISTLSPYLTDATNMYCFEKYLRGFVDIYTYCGLEDALTMAVRLVDWAIEHPTFTEAQKRLGDNGGDKEIEWYTITESLVEFANALKRSGKYNPQQITRYMNFAKEFAYDEYWDIFRNGKSLYDYDPEHGINIQYFHAYSHVNTFNSAAALYRETSDSKYLDSMKAFYEWMQKEQVLSTGGYGAHTEWLAPRDKQIGFLQTYHDNFETQCNCYAVYRMNNNLINFTGNAEYGDWIEKLMYNGTIASLETDRGFAFYYSDYCTKGGSKYLKEDWKWSCCTGTRPLNTNELLRSIYFNDSHNLYVSLYTNSTITWESNNGSITLTQQSNFPTENTVKFTVNTDRTDKFAIKMREPSWLSEDYSVKVNGELLKVKTDKQGWIDINRVWSDGDQIELVLPMKVTLSKLEEEFDYGPDGVWAVNCGPVALAAKNVFGIKPEYVVTYDTFKKNMKAGKDALHFTVENDGLSLEYKPFWEYTEGEGYYLYLNLYDYDLFG